MRTKHVRSLSALDAIFTRRSVRAYTPEALDDSTVRGLLDAAIQAPTAMRLEPWAFIVIQDQLELKRISDRASAGWGSETSHYRELHASPDSIFYDASTLIVVCAKPLGAFVVADCWLAAENLMIAASALGLGSCCVGSAVPALNSAETKSELAIPADIEAIAPIIVGVPRAPVSEVARKAPQILYWSRPRQ